MIFERARHIAYAGGWKILEPMWDWVIRAKRVAGMLPILETVLTGFGTHPSREVRTNLRRSNNDAAPEGSPQEPSPGRQLPIVEST
jgi:hypothetical protein